MSILILFQLAIHQDTDEEDIAVYITGTAEGNRSALTLIRYDNLICNVFTCGEATEVNG